MEFALEIDDMRTAQTIAAQESGEQPNEQPKYKRGQHPNSRANLVAPWQPGQQANPDPSNNGRDVAREIARAVFGQNPELIYKAFADALNKGNAYAFQVLADRAFGKTKDVHEVTGKDGQPIETSLAVRFVEADGDR